MDDRLLAIYLRDHLAGATGGLELARRAAGNNEGNDFGPPLAELAREIAEDRATLEGVMDRLGVGPDRVMNTLAWAGEKLARLKPSGRLVGYSPLSRFLEIEALIAGVSGKLSLWRTLRDIAPQHPKLDTPEFETLAARAESQLERLDELRRRAAIRAFV